MKLLHIVIIVRMCPGRAAAGGRGGRDLVARGQRVAAPAAAGRAGRRAGARARPLRALPTLRGAGRGGRSAHRKPSQLCQHL